MNAVYAAIGISKQAVHQQIKRQQLWEANVADLVTEVNLVRQEHPGCGVEKMYDIIQPSFVGRDRFVALLISMGYRVQKQRNHIRTTQSVSRGYSPNYIEGMLVDNVNRIWQSDITYILVGGVYCYLTFIIDVYSKRIIGYHASAHMRAEANITALKKAFRSRNGISLQGLIHHSDRGSQYNDKAYKELLREHGVIISMCEKAPDNAYAERINGTIKNEYLKYWSIQTVEQLRKAVRRAVTHYNTKRSHRHLPGKLTPLEFEKQIASKDTSIRKGMIIYAQNHPDPKPAYGQLGIRVISDLTGPVCPVNTLNNIT